MAEFNRTTNKISYDDQTRVYQTGYYKSLDTSSSKNITRDLTAPLSFREWVKQQRSLEPNSHYDYYLAYITEWYKNTFTKEQIRATIKNNYINLLKQLNIELESSETQKWFNSLKLTEDLDIQDMIDFYSRKLKDIAVFLSKQRDKLKTVKTKYNTIGSNFGIQKSIFNNIYDKIKEENISDLNLDFKVIVKELYDDTNYFDKSPHLPSSSYYNLTSSSVLSNLSSLNLSPSDANWIYKLGSFDITTTSALETNLELKDYANISENVLASSILIELTEKFIGESLYNIDFVQSISENPSFTYNFVGGNNWFYWPSGEYIFESSDLNIQDIPLSATSLLLVNSATSLPIATANTTYSNSDRIFVIEFDTIKGAWAQRNKGTTITDVMSAFVQGSDNLLFKYPFPGYGEASSTLPWTGKTKENVTSIYRYLDRESQILIENSYFKDTTIDDLPLNPITLNETTLVESGAKAGKQYKNSDHIIFTRSTNIDRVRDSLPDGVFTDQLQYSWLYDFTTTNINVNTGPTNILWPLQTYIEIPDTRYIVSDDFCTNIQLSTLNHSSFIGARAGSGLYDADTIYIRESQNGALTQCAWLSGKEIKHALGSINADNTRFTAEISGTHQPGLFIKCFPGQYSTFIWADQSIDINQTSITYHKIPEDSTYATNQHYSIFKSRLLPLDAVYNLSVIPEAVALEYRDFGLGPGIGDWKSDESRSVLYSPIGHPGDIYSDYEKMCDIIFVDHTFPDDFSLDSWRDSEGRDYTTSPDFGWYKLQDTSLQPDVGWGQGTWVNYDGSTSFILSAGYQYKYLRTNLRRRPADLDRFAVPYLAIKQPYTIAETKWIKADFIDGAFVETENNIDTDIIIKPNDSLVYDHYNVTTYCITALDTRDVEQTTDYPRASSTNFDRWFNYNILESGQTLLGTWPTKLFYEGPTTGPSPLSGIESLYSITWYVSNDGGLPEKRIETFPGNLLSLEVSAGSSNIEYWIQATGYVVSSATTTELIQIPVETHELYATAIPVTPRFVPIGSLIYETIEQSTLPVNVCVTVSGWDVENNIKDPSSPHGKPTWVLSTDLLTPATKNKGVPVSDRSYYFEHEILLQSQPPISDIVLDSSTTLDYKRVGPDPLTWVQPLEYVDDTPTYQWKKLNISNINSPLSSFTCEQFETFNVQQTDEPSDIILRSPGKSKTSQQYINYFAIAPIQWTQQFTLKQRNVIKTYNKTKSITATFPGLQLLNRHYPTVASAPYFENVKNEDEVGVFKPSNLGLSIYLGKNYTSIIDPNVKKTTNIQDPNKYEADYGLTKELNPSPIIRRDFDAQWMKYSSPVSSKAGFINNTISNQKFTAYQSDQETKAYSNNGINQTIDLTDPWTGFNDTVLAETPISITDFRGQFNFNKWLDSFVTPVSAPLYDWSSDLYGNQYGIFKNIHGVDPYTQLKLPGEIWCRTSQGSLENIKTGLSFLTDIFFANNMLVQEIQNQTIQQFFAVNDILVLVGVSGIGITEIDYNYQTNKISVSNNNYHSITLNDLTGLNSLNIGKGIFVPELQKIFFPAIAFSTTTPVVYIFEYDIERKALISLQLDQSIMDISTYLSDNELVDITYPSLTYSENLNKFNCCFVCRKQLFDGDNVISITFSLQDNQTVNTVIDKLTP